MAADSTVHLKGRCSNPSEPPEYVAEMLGVRRTSVSVVAHTSQQAGMINYARGRIKLTDIPALQETACECYEVVKLNYDAMFHPSNE